MTVNFVPSRIPLVDPRTGLITREWYLLLQGLFGTGNTGTEGGDTIADLAPAAISGDELASSLLADVEQFGVEPLPPLPPIIPDDLAPLIGALRDEIAQLRAQVDDLQKGVPVL